MLFIDGRGGHYPRDRRLAGELRVRAQQRESLIFGRAPTVSINAPCNASIDANGSDADVRSTIHGECSKTPASAAANARASSLLSSASVIPLAPASAFPRRRVRMRRDPVPRDVDATRNPDAVVPLHVVEETRERRDPSRAPDEPAMQADRQHLRRVEAARIAFAVERVERVAQVREELLAAVESLRRREAHVVGVERIRHDEMRLAPSRRRRRSSTADRRRSCPRRRRTRRARRRAFACSALTYAKWGVDYLKYDWCSTDSLHAPGAYMTMRDALAKARPIVFSICEWGTSQPWKWAANVGHLWRTTGDITACFDCIKDNVTWKAFGVMQILDMQQGLRVYAGPGHWNDPDMLEVGNGLTPNEDRAHFAMWSMLAAPLIAGNDLRSMPANVRDVLSNREVIAVDQDSLGVQGFRYAVQRQRRDLVQATRGGDWALTFLNRATAPRSVSFDWAHEAVADRLSKRDAQFATTRYQSATCGRSRARARPRVHSPRGTGARRPDDAFAEAVRLGEESRARVRGRADVVPGHAVPVASIMTACSLASAGVTTPATRPSRITTMRSLRSRTSGSSEEIRRIAIPSRSESRISE